ncbi:SGNH hydrolase-type esterase domain-containing protein [Microdochium trichocladiopsis]|uniref:SGNH hydrolase-type esterase domain-containing protein n=1 Tax=Microdochium trichocladiopsis TaxID=1682393 RepID=A0A9P8YHC3_9PEZI|nr:SGNH hydrolase-type esterase domain-containing protein [Microdochium trichocladiopsis]KAH7038160.1 SGNH hydrolase-type esterase domain-containing protein [Microdochium trichocladiopsis]
MATSYNQVVLFGDSLFEKASFVEDGYSLQSALQMHCNRRLDVVNRGMSGWNSRHALQYLPQIFPARSETSPRIEYLVILLGANDATRLDHPSNRQGVSLAEYESNILSIVNHEHIKAHKARILLVTPPPLDEIGMALTDLAFGMGEVTRYARLSAKFSQAVRDIAAKLQSEGRDVRLLDLHEAIMSEAEKRTPREPGTPLLGYPGGVRGALETLLPDGLHINADAYKILYSLIMRNMDAFPPYPEGYVHPDWWTLVYGKTKDQFMEEQQRNQS